MSSDEKDLEQRYKILEKEYAILKKKFERCSAERSELELLLDQTRSLCDVVGTEKLTEEQKKQLAVFKKYVPQEFLKSLNQEDWLNIQLGDHVEHEMTVLFCDIRSFTLLSERMTAEENFAFINTFLRHVQPPVDKHGGFVDKYIGDSIMAVFYNTRDAIDAGIDMQKGLSEFNEIRKFESLPPIKIGVGLHCGKLMLGIIGVENRMQGTVISYIVSLSSHLEAFTKKYGSAMLVTENVLAGYKNVYPNRQVARIKITGKEINYIDIYEILDAEDKEIRNLKLQSKPFFEEGLKLYFDEKFAEASVQFTLALKIYPQDQASLHYLKNSANCMVQGVPQSWDGAEHLYR